MSGSTALVCGGAATLIPDFYKAKELRPDADTIIVNDVSEVLKGDHLFTLHPEKLDKWVRWQEDAFHHIIPTISYKTPAGLVLPCSGTSGSSGWGAAKAALLMGYTEVILCGVPMSPMQYVKRGPAQAFMRPKFLDTYRTAILDDCDLFQYIKSMSGWTRDLMGSPC